MSDMSILVADDDPVIRRLLEKRLKNAGYEVHVTEDGEQAARLLDHRHYEVVITDLVMPGDIGGIELLQIAKEKYPDCEVILITAHSSVDTAVDAMKKGAVDYLEKPINFDELLLRLGKIEQVRSLVRNAGDLRVAMDVTESSAAETIQSLEYSVGQMQSKIDQAGEILRSFDLDLQERIDKVLDLIER